MTCYHIFLTKVLHLVTVDKLLYELQPPLKKDHLSQNLIPWLNDLRLCQNTINSILSLSPLNQWIESLNQMWQFIQAMRMFLEHIMLRHSKVSVKYARRLEIVCAAKVACNRLSLFILTIIGSKTVWARLPQSKYSPKSNRNFKTDRQRTEVKIKVYENNYRYHSYKFCMSTLIHNKIMVF